MGTLEKPLQALSAICAALMASQGCDLEGHVGDWTASLPPSAADGEAAGARSATATSPSDTGVEDASGAAAAAISKQMPGSMSAGPANLAAPTQPDVCSLARDAATAPQVTVVDTNAVVYNFAGGAVFPPGRYRVTYVDGCRRYDNTEAWTLHASVLASALSPQGRGGCYLVMSNGQALELAPGTSGVVVGDGPDPAGAFASYDECVAANLKLAPLELTFSGGTLGIMNAGDSTPDKTSGEAVGQRSPTFRLTRSDACP